MAAAIDPATRRELHYASRVVDCFVDRPSDIHAMLEAAVAARPDAEALVCGELRFTWAQLDEEVRRLAAALHGEGVGPGDRVALLLGNDAPFVVLTYAVARLGAILVPLSLRDQTPGLRHALVQSGAKILICEPEAAEVVPPMEETPALVRRFALGKVEGFCNYHRLLGADPEAAPPPAKVDEEAVATILYTSGTTGVPKGAMLTHLGVVHSATAFASFMDSRPGDREGVIAPLSHVTGLVGGVHKAVRAQATLLVMREFKASAFLRLAAAERLTHCAMVPAMYNLCLVQDDPANHDLSAWRWGGYGGAPMPAPTIERLAQKLPNLKLMNCYGATETTSPVTMMPPENTASHRLSVGKSSYGAVTVVMDEDGRECPPGVHGELWHSGPMVVPGYWENPEATAKEFAGGFWKSGDIGSIDADGFVYVHDRKKDMVNRGGYKIFTAQVESVLAAFPGVTESAVVAKPCPVLGERVHAVVVAPEPLDEGALAAHCRRELADYQAPESFTITPEPLPRNHNGKIMKREIREKLDFVARA